MADDTALQDLVAENARRIQEIGVALNPVGLLQAQANTILEYFEPTDEDLAIIEFKFQQVISRTLDAAEQEKKAKRLTVIEGGKTVEKIVSDKVVPDISGGDVRGDRNGHLRAINDTWGE